MRRPRRTIGLEESSAPSPTSDQEDEENNDDEDPLTNPMFWRASANTVVIPDHNEPTTFQEAVSGLDQVHWHKAIQAELKSMRLRGVFRAAKLPKGHRAVGTK